MKKNRYIGSIVFMLFGNIFFVSTLISQNTFSLSKKVNFDFYTIRCEGQNCDYTDQSFTMNSEDNIDTFLEDFCRKCSPGNNEKLKYIFSLFKIRVNDSSICIDRDQIPYDEKKDDSIIVHEKTVPKELKNIIFSLTQNSRTNSRLSKSSLTLKNTKTAFLIGNVKKLFLLISSLRPNFHQQKSKSEDNVLTC
jgi:hypothetical protein